MESRKSRIPVLRENGRDCDLKPPEEHDDSEQGSLSPLHTYRETESQVRPQCGGRGRGASRRRAWDAAGLRPRPGLVGTPQRAQPGVSGENRTVQDGARRPSQSPGSTLGAFAVTGLARGPSRTIFGYTAHFEIVEGLHAAITGSCIYFT